MCLKENVHKGPKDVFKATELRSPLPHRVSECLRYQPWGNGNKEADVSQP